MTDDSSTSTGHLSVAMTTAGGVMTSSSSRDTVKFYFKCSLVMIAVLGMAANGLVLYALVASRQHKKHVLIVNQNALDCLSCLLLVITYSLQLSSPRLTDDAAGSYVLCTLLLSEALSSSAILASIINLACVTVERYLRVVHATWSKTKLRQWMIYTAMLLTWVSALTYSLALVFPTTVVTDGVCYAYTVWKNPESSIVWMTWNFILFYVIILFIFIFCYWRIVRVIRRQAAVMAGHSADAAAAAGQLHSLHQTQTNVIKTMILVSTFYAVSWLPNYIFVLFLNLNRSSRVLPDSGYYASVLIALVYICTNPFIYATKFDPVKQVLLRIMPCRKTSHQVSVNVITVRSVRTSHYTN